MCTYIHTYYMYLYLPTVHTCVHTYLLHVPILTYCTYRCTYLLYTYTCIYMYTQVHDIQLPWEFYTSTLLLKRNCSKSWSNGANAFTGHSIEMCFGHVKNIDKVKDRSVLFICLQQLKQKCWIQSVKCSHDQPISVWVQNRFHTHILNPVSLNVI